MAVDHAYKHRSEYDVYFMWVIFLHIEYIDAYKVKSVFYILYVTKYIYMK